VSERGGTERLFKRGRASRGSRGSERGIEEGLRGFLRG